MKKKFIYSIATLMLTGILMPNKVNALYTYRDTHENPSLSNHIGTINTTPQVWMWHSSSASTRAFWNVNYYNYDKQGANTIHRVNNGDVRSFFTKSKVFVDDIIIYVTLPEQARKFINTYGLENLGIKFNVGPAGSVNNNAVTYTLSGSSLRIVFRPILKTDNVDLWKSSPVWSSMNSYGKIDIPKVTSGYGTNYVSATANGVGESAIVTDALIANAKAEGGVMKFNNGGNVMMNDGRVVNMTNVTVSATVFGGGSHGVYYNYPITLEFYDTNIKSNDISVANYEYYSNGVYWVKSGDEFNANLSAYTTDTSSTAKVNSHHLQINHNGVSSYMDSRLHSNQDSIAKWSSGSSVAKFISGNGYRSGNTLNSNYTLALDGDKDITLKGLSRMVKFNTDFSSESIYKESWSGNTITVKSDSTGPTITLPQISSWITSDKTITASASDSRSGVRSTTLRYRHNGGSWSNPSTSLSLNLNKDGKYEVEVVSTDNVGNQSTASATYHVDKTAPSITLSPSTDKWTNKDVTINISKTDDGSKIKTTKYATGTRDINYFANSGTTITTNSIVTSINQTYTVYAEDNAGHKSVRTITVSNIDKAKPTISLTPNTTSFTNANITVTATIDSGTETGSGKSPIATKKYAAGNRDTAYFSSNGTTLSGNTFTISTNGTYTVYAKDEAGNEFVRTISISNIDKTAPTITGDIDYPWVRGSRYVNLTTSDTQTQIKSFKIWDNTKTQVIKNGVANGNGMRIEHTFTTEGEIMYKLESIDSVNNTVTQTMVIRIDNTAPTAKVTIPTSTTSRNINVNISNIVDVHSGIQQCIISESDDFRTNNKTLTITGANQNISYTLLKKDTAQANYTKRPVYVKLIDKVGNSKIYTLNTDLMPVAPSSVTVKTPTENQAFIEGESVLISWDYTKSANDFDLPQKKAIITVRNIDTNQTSVYENNNSLTTYMLGTVVPGRYEIKVQVIIDTNYNIGKTSSGRMFRYNYFNRDGNVNTIHIDAGNNMNRIVVVTDAVVPKDTTLVGNIYYSISPNGVVDETKFMPFKIDSEFNTSNIVLLPQLTNKLQVRYTMRNNSNNKIFTPIIDHITVYGK